MGIPVPVYTNRRELLGVFDFSDRDIGYGKQHKIIKLFPPIVLEHIKHMKIESPTTKVEEVIFEILPITIIVHDAPTTTLTAIVIDGISLLYRFKDRWHPIL